MTDTSPEIRVTDSKARVTLPRSFANSTLLVEVRSENEIVIRKAKVVPLDASETGPTRITLSEQEWDAFVTVLENPPPPNAELKKLMTEFGPWEDGAKFSVEEPPPVVEQKKPRRPKAG